MIGREGEGGRGRGNVRERGREMEGGRENDRKGWRWIEGGE